MKNNSASKIDLSIVMPFRNEGSEPGMTVKSILETCASPDVEILAINDCSDKDPEFPYCSHPQVRYIQNKERLGVTVCRDFGVDAAKSDNVLIIDGHMRFRKDNWLEKGIAAIQDDPESIFFTRSVDIGSGNFDLGQAVLPFDHGLPCYTGCSLKLFLTPRDNPLRPAGYRNIIESKWIEERAGKIYPVPCMMGSNYFFKKKWYQKLHGFRGLKTWGNSEPFLSLKSWIAGGQVKIITDIEIGHLYRNQNPNAIPHWHIIYNKAVTAKILFTPEFAEELLQFMEGIPGMDKVRELLKINAEEIEAERRYFMKMAKMSPIECFKKLGIDYTDPVYIFSK